MSENELKVGTVVQLQSGGPPMTIEKIDGERVGCVWFERESGGRYYGEPLRADIERALVTTTISVIA